jgi:hypothetical protein
MILLVHDRSRCDAILGISASQKLIVTCKPLPATSKPATKLHTQRKTQISRIPSMLRELDGVDSNQIKAKASCWDLARSPLPAV